MNQKIYVDHAATTFLWDEALEAMLPFLKGSFGNPSSLHSYGEESAEAIADARSAIADIVSCSPDQIIFTSGGSESDNQAMLYFKEIYDSTKRNILLISGGEHHAVWNAAKALTPFGIEVVAVPLREDGEPSYDKIHELAERFGDKICGGSFMLANNETGSIFDIRRISRIIHNAGGAVHTDAVQAVGHIPVSFSDLEVDLLSLSAHKFHGPKGIGALICRDPANLPSLIHGGAQESGRRAGTENTAAIIGMAAALSASAKNIQGHIASVSRLRDLLKKRLISLPGAHVNGGGLPGILSVRFDGADGEALVRSLDLYGIAASAGAACNSTHVVASPVLISMGLSEEAASSTVRFSLDASNTEEEIMYIGDTMSRLIC